MYCITYSYTLITSSCNFYWTLLIEYNIPVLTYKTAEVELHLNAEVGFVSRSISSSNNLIVFTSHKSHNVFPYIDALLNEDQLQRLL